MYFVFMMLLTANLAAVQGEKGHDFRASRGLTAWIPCASESIFFDGPDSYILWIKNNTDMVSRLDLDTCTDQNCTNPSWLNIPVVSDTDAGEYRCRIHYQGSPSVDHVVNLSVVDSLPIPRIFEKNGREIHQVYGPIREGAHLYFQCTIDDNSTGIDLFWKKDGHHINHINRFEDGHQKSVVEYGNVTRDDHESVFECFASNADVTPPIKTSVTVEMTLPPTRVEIRLDDIIYFELGSPRIIDCLILGSVPHPDVYWTMGRRILEDSLHTEIHEGNISMSSLTYVPRLSDNGSKLICVAENPNIDAAYSDSIRIWVGYPPICMDKMKDDSELPPLTVNENETITVSCLVKSSSWPTRAEWSLQRNEIRETIPKLVDGHSGLYNITLNWTPSMSDQGQLHCRAENLYGMQKTACMREVKVIPAALENEVDCTNSDGKAENGEDYIISKKCKQAYENSKPRSNRFSYLEQSAIVIPGVVVGVVALSSILLALRNMATKRQMEREMAVIANDGAFHREPDVVRNMPNLECGTTNITVNQNCSKFIGVKPSRVMVGCNHEAHSLEEHCSYYV